MTSNRIDKWAVRDMLMRLDMADRMFQHVEQIYPAAKALTEAGSKELGKVRDTILSASTVDITLDPKDAA